jgi:2-polyprenyl-3-methyl-5-hydroxy-6-metoxy-1,4-benzoquinol methylase
MIQNNIRSDTSPPMADVILALLEQKALGVYQGDLKPNNLRCNTATGLCVLIDYDQAELLNDETVELSNIEYLDWCHTKARLRYNFDSFLQYFPDVSFEAHVAPLFRNGAFNIGTTALFKQQETTLAACGIYHSFDFDSVFADGERAVDRRTELLDGIEFSKGERVLDVGCNAGLLSLYLHGRGCEVSGIDIDQSVILGAKIIANLLGKKISYDCVDIDHAAIPEGNNTVILFSVIHHTQNIAENARSIAERCNRIIIECRPIENGAKPVTGIWKSTSSWHFGTVQEMVVGLEALFPNFMLKKNHGQVDRERYILEFSKEP